MNASIRLLPLLLGLTLAACASEPVEKRAEAEPLNCGAPAPPIGSHIVKRERCVPSTEESRAEARREVERMRNEQERQRRTSAPGS